MPSRQRDDRRREEILPALRDDPVRRQRERRARVVGEHARHGAHANAVHTVLPNDGVEARDDGVLVDGESDVVRPACRDAKTSTLVTPVRYRAERIRTVLDELEAVRDTPRVRDEDKAARVHTVHRRPLDLESRCTNMHSPAELRLTARGFLSGDLGAELDPAPDDAPILS